MSSLLCRYLYKTFLLWWAFLLLGMTAFLLLFDVMAQAGDILQFHKSSLSPLATYARLRLPEIINLLIPATVLLGFIVTFTRLVISRQIITMRAFGYSLYQFVWAFFPLVLLIAVFHMMFANIVLPESAAALRDWQAKDYREAPRQRSDVADPPWFVDGTRFIRPESAGLEGNELTNITLIERNADGQIHTYRTARKALYTQEQTWALYGMHTVYSFEEKNEDNEDSESSRTEEKRQPSPDRPAENLPTMTIAPEQLARLYKTQEETSLGELLVAFQDRKDKKTAQNISTESFLLWLHRKLAHPASSLIMLLLAAPLALQTSRRPKIMKAALGAILAGFIYFIIERISFTLGESALLPPLFAAWAPFGIFALIGVWILLLAEEYD